MNLLANDEQSAPRDRGWPIAITADNKPWFVSLLGHGDYDVDVADIRGFRNVGSMAEVLVRDSEGHPRLMQAGGDYLVELSPETFKPLPSSPGSGGGRYSVFPFSKDGNSARVDADGIFGRVYWRDGDIRDVCGNWPAVYSECSVGQEGCLWLGFRVARVMNTSQWVIGYRPAPRGAKDWASEDRWIGPFRLPGQGTTTAMSTYGRSGLLVSTTMGIYLCDCAEAIKQPEAVGWSSSTAEWRKQYEQRLTDSDYRGALMQILAWQKWDRAEAILGRQQPKSPQERVVLALWKAHLLVRKGDPSAAADAYGAAAVDAAAQKYLPAEVFARIIQIVILHQAGRYREMLDLYPTVAEKFPQAAAEDTGNSLGELAWYIKDARKKLAAQGRTAPATTEQKP